MNGLVILLIFSVIVKMVLTCRCIFNLVNKWNDHFFYCFGNHSAGGSGTVPIAYLSSGTGTGTNSGNGSLAIQVATGMEQYQSATTYWSQALPPASRAARPNAPWVHILQGPAHRFSLGCIPNYAFCYFRVEWDRVSCATTSLQETTASVSRWVANIRKVSMLRRYDSWWERQVISSQ
jgi:hypothetical protein